MDRREKQFNASSRIEFTQLFDNTHVGFMIQIHFPGRVAEITDRLLALLLAVILGLSERLQYSAATFRLKLTFAFAIANQFIVHGLLHVT